MIITSMLENDLYKFSMSHYYQIHYPNAWGTFIFHDRNNTQYSDEFLAALKCELAIYLEPSSGGVAVGGKDNTLHPAVLLGVALLLPL